MWKREMGPLFSALFYPRDMVGNGEWFPQRMGKRIFSTRFQGGIHRNLWEIPYSVCAAHGANKSNHFSDDMRVRKILLGQQVCPTGARSRPQTPWQKSHQTFRQIFAGFSPANFIALR